MKAIIVAAGPGSRLNPFTNERPKCLLNISGRAILERVLEASRDNGIKDIVVVRGYKKELLTYTGIRYYENTDYEKNNILRSLFYAEDEMNDDFIFSYSDILYGKEIMEKLVHNQADIALIVDVSWMERYEGRNQHPVSEAELVMVANNRITKIGKDVVKPGEAYGEFIGLAKFTKRGAEILKSNYHRIAAQDSNRPFHQAPSLDKAYLTDMIQELVDLGYVIRNVDIQGGWMEIDTPEDLTSAHEKWPG